MPDPGRTRARTASLWLMGILTVTLFVVFALGRLGVGPGDYEPRRYPTPAIPPIDAAEPSQAVVRPEDYGALGNGVHDDAVALQAALDDADGRIVELSADTTYLSTQALTLPSHTTLRGDKTSVLAFTWEHSVDVGSGGPFYLGNEDQLGGNDDIVLDGFSIKGAGDGLPAGPMDPELRNLPSIRLRHVNTFVIRGLDVGFSPGISILYQGSVHGLLTDNHVHDSGRDGITGNSLRSEFADVTVSDNLIERVGDDGIAIAGATTREFNSTVLPTDIRIFGNRIEGWAENPNGIALGRGIALIAVDHVEVVDNQISRTAGAGILVRGAPTPDSVNPLDGEPWYSSHITIKNNSITDAAVFSLTSILPENYRGANGIDIGRAEFVVARDNDIDAAVGEPTLVKNCQECEISN